MSKNSCPTKLLEDLPTSEDAFGSHERIAESISSMIDSESGGKSIALTGGWGSGKSSVVKILGDKINDDTQLFIYNAWSHEGDPLRRSFLEELIDFLKEKGWLAEDRKKHWEREKEKLSRKFKEKEVIKSPVLTDAGRAFAILVLLVPVGASLTANTLTSPNGFQIWQLLVYGSLATGPVFFYLILKVLSFFGKGKKNFHFLAQQSSEKINTTTLETPEPTSVEFQDKFSELLKEVLQSSNRKLVIVMDNIDRTDPEEALRIWSTMRTFLDYPSDEAWVNNLWLLVPFDKGSIKELWERSKGTNQPNGQYELGNAFLEKTFQIKYHVPPPLLSNWKNFFLEKLKEVLPRHSDKNFDEVSLHTFEDVYKIFSIKRRNPDSPPTPRQIKLYINKIGALHRQWAHQIPLKHMALFVSLENTEWNPEKELARGKLLREENRVRNVLDEGWQDDLAALYLNKQPKNAMEILLRPQIDWAITENKKEYMKSLTENPGFPDVLLEYLDSELTNGTKEASLVPKLARMLQDTKEKEEQRWIAIWDRMANFILEVDKWDEFTQGMGEGLVNILKFKEDQGNLSKYLKKVLGSLSRFKAEEEANDKETRWVEELKHILEFAIETDDGKQICRSSFKVPGPPEFYVRVSGLLEGKGNSQELYPFFQPDIETKKIISYLKRRSKENNYDLSDLGAIKVLKRIEESIDWSPLADQIKNNFQNQNPTEGFNQEESTAFIKTLFELREDFEKADNTLLNLVQNGNLAHYLQQFRGNNKAAATLLFPILIYQPNLNFKNWGNANQGRDFINNVMDNPAKYETIIQEYLALIYNYSSFEKILQTGKEGNTSFLSHLVDKILKVEEFSIEGFFKGTGDYEILVEEFPLIMNSLKEEKIELIIDKLMNNGELIDQLIELPFKIASSKFYQLIIQEEPPDRFLKFLRSNIQIVESEIWHQELQGEGNLITLLIKFNSNQKIDIDIKPEHLSIGLEEYSKSVIQGNSDPSPEIKDQWETLLSYLTKDDKNTLLKNIIDEIIRAERDSQEPTTGKLLELYEHHLRKWKILKPTINEIVRVVFAKMLDRNNEPEIRWMSNFFEENASEINIEEIESIDNFRSKLKEKLDSDISDDQIKSKLQTIYDIITEEDSN